MQSNFEGRREKDRIAREEVPTTRTRRSRSNSRSRKDDRDSLANLDTLGHGLCKSQNFLDMSTFIAGGGPIPTPVEKRDNNNDVTTSKITRYGRNYTLTKVKSTNN